MVVDEGADQGLMMPENEFSERTSPSGSTGEHNVRLTPLVELMELYESRG
jgi:hypothetical protein